MEYLASGMNFGLILKVSFRIQTKWRKYPFEIVFF